MIFRLDTTPLAVWPLVRPAASPILPLLLVASLYFTPPLAAQELPPGHPTFGAPGADASPASPSAPNQSGAPAPPADPQVAALISGARQGNLQQISDALSFGVDVNAKDPAGWTALTAAMSMGNQDVVKFLLHSGADPNTPDPREGLTPLFYAAASGDVEFLEELIAEGADPNLSEPTEGQVPLHIAAARGLAESVEALLDAGARPAPPNRYGMTPLMAAVHPETTRNPQVVRLLLEAESQLPEEERTGPASLALARDSQELLDLFTDFGADVSDLPDPAMTAKLMETAAQGDAARVRELIDEGAPVDASSGLLEPTPLANAAARGHLEVVQTLLDAGANPNPPLTNGMTVLTLAARRGHADVVDALLAAGVEPLAPADPLGGPVIAAIVNDHPAIALRLIEAGADVNARESQAARFTALMVAVLHDQPDVARALLEKGAAVNETSEAGDTALLIAVSQDKADFARLLLEHGADPNQANRFGMTPLRIAEAEGKIELSEMLRQAGAN